MSYELSPHGKRIRVAFRFLAAALTVAFTACTSLSFFVANAPVAFGEFNRSTDLPYGRDARQRLDVVSPKTGQHPVVLFFYGGSWTTGQKSQYGFVAAALAAHGYVTVIPDYRLYPQVRFPELMDDGAQAVAWVWQHAREFNGDPERIVLMGHSAGAHMAAMLALNRTYIEKVGVPPRSIVGLIGLSGPYALIPDSDSLRAIFARPYTPDDWQPLHFASARAPPTLLLQGLDDKVVSPIQSQKLRDALDSHGVAVETHFYAGRGHVDTLASFSVVARFRTPALQNTLTFLARVTMPNGNAGVKP